MSKDKSREELLLEIQELQARLSEAEETLRAIRSGEIDALVISGAQGEQVYTLKGAEQPYRVLIEEMKEGAITLAADNTILYCNGGFAQMLKIPLERMIGTGIADFILPSDHAEFEELLLQGREESSKGEIKFRAGDGTSVPVYLSINSFQMEGISAVYLVAIDLTEHKRADDRIREQAVLLDKAQDAIVVRDLEHRLIYWNKGAQHLYGWTEEEVTGKNADELLYKDKESPRLVEAKKCVLERGEWKGELYQVTKDGKEIIVESRWTLMLSRRDNPKSILIINTDITEKKNIEAQFLRAQRMESIGTLAGGIAHDMNNVLTPVMLSLQILRERFRDEESQKLLNILDRSTRRGADLIKQVLLFSRGSEGERRATQIAHVISEIEKITKEIFPRFIEIRTDVPKDLWMISGDATQLHQVLMNLCINARDAMPGGGTLHIFAENFLIDKDPIQINVEAKVGSYIIISVSDTGTGIPPEIMDKIFEPFFTTKKQGKGTGLGLSTAISIVKSHGGFIDVHSKVGEGTTFKLYLPAIRNEMQKAEVSQNGSSGGHGESILVVDDEAPIREIARTMLETNGFRVLTASDGAEAVALYVQNREDIKVVLMDMMMPVMEGPECIQVLHKANPAVKIIAVSGLSEKDRLAKVAGYVNTFLPKPFTAERLLKTINEVINAM